VGIVSVEAAIFSQPFFFKKGVTYEKAEIAFVPYRYEICPGFGEG
jgi:hypothetical protein